MSDEDGHLLLGPVEADEEVDEVEAGELDTLPVDGPDHSHQGLEGVHHPDLVAVPEVGAALVEQGVQVVPHAGQLVGLQPPDLPL